ncbi:MAG TPA: hypothetical protein VHJ17_23800 [Thermomonospora sp.]|nr:hypothetical protein [Thermomonospora sp.]
MLTNPWRTLALLLKAALAVLLLLAVLFPEWDRFADKAMGVRAVAYPLTVLTVAAMWALRGRRGAYPWDVDALLTAPFVIDVAGNAADLYDRVSWFDDACHYGNWFLLAAAAGLALRRWSGYPPSAIALSCAGIGAVTAIVWEFFEYGVFILDTPESVTLYRDTVGDLMLGLLGASSAGLLTGRMARLRPGRGAPRRGETSPAGR